MTSLPIRALSTQTFCGVYLVLVFHDGPVGSRGVLRFIEGRRAKRVIALKLDRLFRDAGRCPEPDQDMGHARYRRERLFWTLQYPWWVCFAIIEFIWS